jgi:MYXO-CTERM domain-containing protein
VTLKGTVAVALAIASISVSATARASTQLDLTNGITGDGALTIPVDDFGVYGSLVIQGSDDFQPATSINERPTFLAGLILVVRTSDGKQTTASLSDSGQWHLYTEGGGTDGIIGTHASVVRQIVTGLTVNNGVATSAFRLSAQNAFDLAFGLTQRITIGTPSTHSTLEQKYDIKNNGTTAVDVVIHAVWEADLYYDDPSPIDDIAGAVPGLCAVYLRDPGGTQRSVALSSGPLSTVPMTYYFAGNAGDTGVNPALEGANGTNQWTFNNATGGMPTTWRNYVSGVGVSVAGEQVSPANGDATMGIEFRFSVAAGQTETVHIRRQYGSTTVPCPSPPMPCGNGQVDANLGEPCDGADTDTCNGATCMLNTCGDGHINTLAGETCEELADTEMCDAMSCRPPSCGDGYTNATVEECDDGGETEACNADCTVRACGDGYVNVMAEDCDGDPLCDPTTCRSTYTLGGGCAGCTSETPSSLWLAAFVLGLSVRRRRRARAA